MHKTVNAEVASLNAIKKLKHTRQQFATRPFLARGVSVNRCAQCLLWKEACMCSWRISMTIEFDFVLIYHRDELFKPTNTGRLIADLFPENTHAFLWDRVNPSEELLHFLSDENRNFVLVFPSDNSEKSVSPSNVFSNESESKEKRLTFVLLDGTWRQGRKMSKASWIKNLPSLDLNPNVAAQMSIRSAAKEGMLSTAEAAALCLQAVDSCQEAEALMHYFKIFDVHYCSTRSRALPVTNTEHHLFLNDLRQSLVNQSEDG